MWETSEGKNTRKMLIVLFCALHCCTQCDPLDYLLSLFTNKFIKLALSKNTNHMDNNNTEVMNEESDVKERVQKKFKKLLQVRNQIPNNVIIMNHCLGKETTFFSKSTFSATFLVGQRQVQERKKILFWQCQRHHCQQHGGPHHGYVHP